MFRNVVTALGAGPATQAPVCAPSSFSYRIATHGPPAAAGNAQRLRFASRRVSMSTHASAPMPYCMGRDAAFSSLQAVVQAALQEGTDIPCTTAPLVLMCAAFRIASFHVHRPKHVRASARGPCLPATSQALRKRRPFRSALAPDRWRVTATVRREVRRGVAIRPRAQGLAYGHARAHAHAHAHACPLHAHPQRRGRNYFIQSGSGHPHTQTHLDTSGARC